MIFCSFKHSRYLDNSSPMECTKSENKNINPVRTRTMALVIIKTLAHVCLRGANYFPGNPITHVGNTVAHTSLSVSRVRDTARDTALGFNKFKHCNHKKDMIIHSLMLNVII